MATYLQNVTDYIPQIQPFRPDYNFLGNVLQTKQTSYDASRKKINDLYGSLLYAPLTKDSNIKRRDEFFKVIDNDIKRISGMDLSLQQNVDQATKVFKGFTDDKFLVRDMVWTKGFQSNVDKHENLKNCNDPKKCGDLQAWDEGLQELQYKQQEFKNTTDEESMNFAVPEYTGYFNWQKQAITEALNKNYTVSKDTIKGGYIVHDTNGELVQGGLYSLYKNAYGNDPRVNSNYATKAFVTRKNNIAQMSAQYGSEEEAQKVYIQKMMDSGIKAANKQLKGQTDYYDQLNSRQLQLEKTAKGKGLTTAEETYLAQVIAEKERVAVSKGAAQSTIDEITNNLDKGNIKALLSRVDRATAAAFEDADLQNMAATMSLQGKEHTIKEDQYGLIRARAAEDRFTNKINFGYDLEKMSRAFGYDVKLEEIKQGIKSGDIPSDDGIILESTPGGTGSLDLEDNQEALFERNRTKENSLFIGGRMQTANMLFNLYAAANKVAGNNNGAEQYLKRTFGDDYKKYNITDGVSLQKALDARKLPTNAAFKDALNLKESTNPSGDNSWAQPIFTNNADNIQEIRKLNDAAIAHMKFNTDNNKKVVNKIAALASSDNLLAKYAPLILTSGGFLDHTGDGFVKKYKDAKYKDGIMVSDSEARSAFEDLKEQFYPVYNKTNNISLEEGVDLSGGGTMTGPATLYKGLDSKNKDRNGRLVGAVGDVVTTLTQALSTPGAAKVVIGDSSKDAFDQKDNAEVRTALNILINDALKANAKTEDRPVFDAIFSPIAGEDIKQSAITLKFDPETLKKFVGTKESPGVLYKKATELLNGVTVFFDDNQVQSPFKKGYTKSATETLVTVNGSYDLDQWESTAGVVHFELDKVTNMVDVSWDKVANVIDKKTNTLIKTTLQGQEPLTIPISSLDKTEKYYKQLLKKQQQDNMISDAGYAQHKKTN
jgi:hypothetical protein